MMAKRPKRSRPVDAREVRAFLGKAEEYLETARHALGQDRMTAATGNAIHAGISACDAICGARLGTRAPGDAHSRRAVPGRTLTTTPPPISPSPPSHTAQKRKDPSTFAW